MAAHAYLVDHAAGPEQESNPRKDLTREVFKNKQDARRKALISAPVSISEGCHHIFISFYLQLIEISPKLRPIMYYGEKLNSISHLVGAALALIGMGALLTVSIQLRDPWVISSFSIFGLSLILLYTMSTLYHSFHPPGLKRLFQLFDHVAIYLLIAGTYTPYLLVSLRDGNGFLMLGIIWGLAVIGILSEIFLRGRLVKVGQMLIFIGMGWACSFDFESLKAALPETGLRWLVAGGVCYTTGILFYLLDATKRLPHAHGIWHFFVLAGSACHFISIIGYIR
ncbi:MAG: hemolysin III family protein [Pseudomonadota bacterium]